MKHKQVSKGLALGLGLSLLAAVSASAGTFSANFNSLQPDPNDSNGFLPPDGTAWYGSITSGILGGYDLRTGGVGNSGVLKLTTATASQNSSFIINNFDGGETPVGFDVAFQLLIGGGNHADGLAVAIGDFPDGAYSEEGPGNIRGLTVVFDIFNNGGTVAEAPAIDLKWNGVTVAHKLLPIGTITTLFPNAFVPVKIHANPDGKVTLTYNNVVVYQDMPIYHVDDFTLGNGWRVGFGARTGGSNDNQWIDDLVITTTLTDATSGQPYITAIAPVNPIDLNASAVGGVSVTLKDSTYSVNPSTVKLLYNGTAVAANLLNVTRIKSDPALDNPDETLITYFGVGGLLPVGAATATIQYSTTSSPAVANSYAFTFTVGAFTTIPASFAVSGADTTKPGFKARVHLIDNHRAPGDANLVINAERQLADGFKDWTTHQPMSNYANLNPDPSLELPIADADGWFAVNLINFDITGQNGNFRDSSTPARPDTQFPGIPGVKSDGSAFSTGAGATENFAVEFVTYLQLKAGGYRFGFNSDDGFDAAIGPAQDAAGRTILGNFNGGRGSADSLFDVVVAADGVYPFRVAYWQGGGGANAELFIIDPTTNTKILVNDPDNLTAPRAYREATGSRPSVQSVLPVQNDLAAFPNDDVVIKLRDGGIALDDSSVVVKINGNVQTVTKSRTGKVLTVTRAGSVDNLLPSGLNAVNVIYSFVENGSPTSITNAYNFSVAPYYNAIPLANKVNPADVDTSVTGFHARYSQMDRIKNGPNDQGGQGRIAGNGDGNRMPNPEIQLWNGEINPADGLPYPNIADPGPNGDFTADMDLVNFNVSVNTGTGVYTYGDSGMFNAGNPGAPLPGGSKPEEHVPGLPSPTFDFTRGVAAGNVNPSNGGLDNYVLEMQTYLDLKKGVYVFGFNSDDGFVVTSSPNPKDTLGTLLGFADFGRGNSGNLVGVTGANPPIINPGNNSGSTVFSVVVPEDGIYPFRALYWNGGGGVNAEFYTLNQDTRAVVLVNDTGATDVTGLTPNSVVAAYHGYTGPAKPWVKFSISPNPWDNRVQQSGPGPLTMLGRTRNSTGSGDIYNWADVGTTGAGGASAHWADVVIGAVLGDAASDVANIKLLLDGTEVPATKTVNGTDVTVAYKPNPILGPGSTHKATLVYAGVSNSWSFKVQNYATINAADKATAPVDPTARGFSVKVVQAAAPRSGGNTAAAAEAQLAGTPADVSIPSGTPDGRFILTGIVNYNNNNNNVPSGGTPIGNFQPAGTYGTGWPFEPFAELPVPGLPGTGTGTGAARWENFTAEIFAWLEFPAAGYYRFGGNVDDGMAVKVGKPGVNTGAILFTQDRGAGAADIPFSFVVPQPGLFPVRLIWWQGGGGAQAEFFTYDENGAKIPVNDPNNPKAIKAYYKLQDAPSLSFAVSGNNLTITWTAGATLQSTTALTAPTTTWTDVGTSGSLTIPLPGPGQAAFYRVKQ